MALRSPVGFEFGTALDAVGTTIEASTVVDADTNSTCFRVKQCLALRPSEGEGGSSLILYLKACGEHVSIEVHAESVEREQYVLVFDTAAGDDSFPLDDVWQHQEFESGSMLHDHNDQDLKTEAASSCVHTADGESLGDAARSSETPGSELDDTGDSVPEPQRSRIKICLEQDSWNNLEIDLARLLSIAFQAEYLRCSGIRVASRHCLVRSDLTFRTTRGQQTKLDILRKLEGEAFKMKDASSLSLVDAHDLPVGGYTFNGGSVASADPNQNLPYQWSQNGRECHLYFSAPPNSRRDSVSVQLSGSLLRVTVAGKVRFSGTFVAKGISSSIRWNLMHTVDADSLKRVTLIHVMIRKNRIGPAISSWWAQVFTGERGTFTDMDVRSRQITDNSPRYGSSDDEYSDSDAESDDDAGQYSPSTRHRALVEQQYDGPKLDITKRICHPQDDIVSVLLSMFSKLESDLQLKLLAMFHVRRCYPNCGRALSILLQPATAHATGGWASASPFWQVATASRIMTASSSTTAITSLWWSSVGDESFQPGEVFIEQPELCVNLNVNPIAVAKEFCLRPEDSTVNSSAKGEMFFQSSATETPDNSSDKPTKRLSWEVLPYDYGCLESLSGDSRELKRSKTERQLSPGGAAFAFWRRHPTSPNNRSCGFASVAHLTIDDVLCTAGVRQAAKPIGLSDGPTSDVAGVADTAAQSHFVQEQSKLKEWNKSMELLRKLLGSSGPVLKRSVQLKTIARDMMATKSLPTLQRLASELHLPDPENDQEAQQTAAAFAPLPSTKHVAALFEAAKGFVTKFPQFSQILPTLLQQMEMFYQGNVQGYDVQYESGEIETVPQTILRPREQTSRIVPDTDSKRTSRLPGASDPSMNIALVAPPRSAAGRQGGRRNAANKSGFTEAFFQKKSSVEVKMLRTDKDHERATYNMMVGTRHEEDVARARLRRVGSSRPLAATDILETGEELEVESRKTPGKWRRATVDGVGDWHPAVVVKVRASNCFLARRAVFEFYFAELLRELYRMQQTIVQRAQKLTGSESEPESIEDAVDLLTAAQDTVREFVSDVETYKSQPKGADNQPPQFSNQLAFTCARLSLKKQVYDKVKQVIIAYRKGWVS